MKTLSIFLALINALMAGLLVAFSLSPTKVHHVPAWWTLTKVSAAGVVILAAVLIWVGSARPINLALLSLCSLSLVALGAATIVWTFHVALVTGDREFYMAVYGGSLAVQGMASLFGFSGESPSMDLHS